MTTHLPRRKNYIWLQAAGRLPGRSLHVAVALWLISDLQAGATVTLSNKLTRQFGVDRNAKYRALAWLQKAGLITTSTAAGRSPRVTIEPIGEDAP